jgi:hypothetical protein
MPYAHGIEEHDCVRFTKPVGRWPAGTKGAVVNTHAEEVEVEIIDRSSGYTLDVVDAPVGSVEVTWLQATQAAV